MWSISAVIIIDITCGTYVTQRLLTAGLTSDTLAWNWIDVMWMTYVSWESACTIHCVMNWMAQRKHRTVLHIHQYKARRQWLLAFQANSYCLLALYGRAMGRLYNTDSFSRSRFACMTFRGNCWILARRSAIHWRSDFLSHFEISIGYNYDASHVCVDKMRRSSSRQRVYLL